MEGKGQQDRFPPSRSAQVLGGRCKYIWGKCDESHAEGLGWSREEWYPSDGGSAVFTGQASLPLNFEVSAGPETGARMCEVTVV